MHIPTPTTLGRKVLLLLLLLLWCSWQMRQQGQHSTTPCVITVCIQLRALIIS
jgi:hypothetical protein